MCLEPQLSGLEKLFFSRWTLTTWTTSCIIRFSVSKKNSKALEGFFFHPPQIEPESSGVQSQTDAALTCSSIEFQRRAKICSASFILYWQNQLQIYPANQNRSCRSALDHLVWNATGITIMNTGCMYQFHGLPGVLRSVSKWVNETMYFGFYVAS